MFLVWYQGSNSFHIEHEVKRGSVANNQRYVHPYPCITALAIKYSFLYYTQIYDVP